MPAEAKDVAFHVLGPAAILVDGRQVELQGKRSRGLLAALLLHEGRVVPSAELITLIWDGDAPKTAANQLQIAVHRLRTALSAAGLDGRLGTRDGGYALDLPEDARVDLHDFRELSATAAARAAAGDWAAARDTGRAALALWKGPAWDGLGAAGPRRAAEAERLTAVELTRAAELVGGDRAALAELRALVAEHPYHQRFWYLLILALALRGRSAEALEAHLAARELHQRDLGTALGPELAALERAILRGEPHAAFDAVRAWTFGAAAPASPGGLPADLRDFTGRAAEGDHIAAILRANPRHRDPAVVVIAGLGGIGKTTFAVRLAHRHAGLFPDGCLFVDLRGFDDVPKDTHAVMGDLLHALGVTGQAVPADPDARLGVYRSVMAGRRVLLVLDNAASEAQVRPLLPVHAASAALVTSRRLLAGLDGAFVVELDVLSPPEAIGLLTGIHRGGGRIAAPAALDRIADLTGRHPLALRILGSRTARMTGGDLATVLARLADEGARLDELSAGAGQVRQSIGFSYGDLGEDAARLLRLAALLPTPRFGVEAAAGLLGTDLLDAEAVLDELADAQLLRPVDHGTRYLMHDLVRLFARERADDEDDPADIRAALDRAFGLLLALAHHADDALGYRYYPTPPPPARTPRPHPESIAAVRADPVAWFEAERELLSAAVGLAAPATAWRLLTTMVNFLDLHAYSHDAIVLIRTALDRADGDEARAALHLALARTARSLGRTDRAVRAAGLARRLYLRLGDDIRAGSATCQFAENLRVLGRPAAAYTAYEHAFALLTPHLADRTAVAQTGWCHKELAVLRLYTRGPAEALESFAEGHPFMVRAGDRGGEARTLGGQGLMNLRLGELREGIAQTEAAAVLLAEAGDRVEEIFVRVELAEAYQRDGRPDEALVAIERAVADTRALRLNGRITTALCTQGRILAAHGRTETAIGLFEEALGLVGEHQPVSRALVLVELAEAHLARGAHALARDYAEGAGAAERIGVDVPGLRARIDAASGSS